MRVFIAGVDGYLGWPLAQHLAFDTDTSAEAAIAILGKSAKADAKPAVPTIAQRNNDALALGGPAPRGEDTAKVAAGLNPASIYESRSKAVGPARR